MAFFIDIAYERIDRHISNLFRREKIGKNRRRRSAKAVGKRLFILLEQRKLTELEEDIRKHVGFFPGKGFRQMETMTS